MSNRTIEWCFRQKRGIRLVEPNDNLADAYMKKAISALNTMNAALKIKETDWIATTAYYAGYFALYSLLMKAGVKSEIHDCSIAIARLLAKEGIIDEESVQDITQSKQTRIDMQYYVRTQIDEAGIASNAKKARRFVLEMEKAIENMSTEQIRNIRAQLRHMQSGHQNRT